MLSGSKIKAHYQITEHLWAVSIDEGQISQVIHNLVINAKQAMPSGGIIEIIAENVEILLAASSSPVNMESNH